MWEFTMGALVSIVSFIVGAGVATSIKVIDNKSKDK